MIIPKLAFRNLMGAGLRTWLNVLVLSFSFFAIIWLQGFYIGMSEQASTAMINSEIGGGQYWQESYDPYDPLSLQDAHAPLPDELKKPIADGVATPILVLRGTIFPDGRLMPVMLKGIDPNQQVLDIPSHVLKAEGDELPALIGRNMAESSHLQVGDYVTVRWRDANGTFDAREAKIVTIMNTIVPTIDAGQVWLPLEELRKMAGMPDEATLVVVAKGTNETPDIAGWQFRGHDYLLSDLREMVKSKSIGGSIMYVMLLSLGMLAIFDTQVLSIFRRRKEIGTMIALGMTRGKVIQLFTFEGALHGVLAVLVGALYGIPVFIYSATHGWEMPGNASQYGFAIGKALYPSYSAALVLGTTLLVLVTVTIVSFLPTRRIARLKPTDALRGKLS